MAAKKRYQVKAAQIVVKVPGAQGGEAYFRKGRLLPDAVEAPETKRLLELGLIEESKEPVAAAADNAGDPAS